MRAQAHLSVYAFPELIYNIYYMLFPKRTKDTRQGSTSQLFNDYSFPVKVNYGVTIEFRLLWNDNMHHQQAANKLIMVLN